MSGYSLLHNTVDMENLQPSTGSIEPSLLICVSENKEWIAYITRSMRLRISRVSMPVNSHYLMPFVEKDVEMFVKQDARCCCFLSVSSDGERVALSFLAQGIFEETERQQLVLNPDCLVFKKHSEYGDLVLEKTFNFQGRAVFLKDGKLALINQKEMKVMDCSTWFRTDYWLDVSILYGTQRPFESFCKSSSVLKTSWANSFDKHYPAAEDIMHISKFLEHNLLSAVYSTDLIRVWSTSNGGVQLMSFNCEPSEQILVFSSDSKLISTFTEESRSINVYDVKNGVRRGSVCLCDGIMANPMIFAHFSTDGKYLVVVSVYQLSDIYSGRNAKIDFQVLDATLEKVYHCTKDIKIGILASDKFLQPFITETSSPNTDVCKAFRVLYSTIEENNTCKIQHLDVEIHTKKEAIVLDNKIHFGDWYVLSRSPFVHTSNSTAPETFGNTIYLKRETLTIQHIVRVDSRTVQLWQLKDTDKWELIYIRAFQAPSFDFNDGYNENWIRFKSRDNRANRDNQGMHYLSQNSDSFDGDQDIYDDIIDYAGVGENPEVSSIHSVEDNSNDMQSGLAAFIQESVMFMEHGPSGRLAVKIAKENTSEYYLDEIYLPLTRDSTDVHVLSGHIIQSACQALYYLKDYKQMEPREKKLLQEIFNQTRNIITTALKSMRKARSIYFATVSGCNILAMLATFEAGKKIIFDIIQTDELAVSLHSFVRKGEDDEICLENALITLIQDYNNEINVDLFNLMFNRILHHAKRSGTSCFPALVDTIMYIQRNISNEELLIQASQRLSFFKDNLPLLISEKIKLFYTITEARTQEPSFIEYSSISSMEQINSYSGQQGSFQTLLGKYLSNADRLLGYSAWVTRLYWYFLFFIVTEDNRKALVSACYTPLYHISSCADFMTNESMPAPKSTSEFLQAVTDASRFRDTVFYRGDTIFDIFLQYKWKTLVRYRFRIVFLIHLIYYITYTVGVSFADILFDYEFGTSVSNKRHIACIALMCLSSTMLLTQEFHLFFQKTGGAWITKEHFNTYNYIKLVPFILSYVDLWQMLKNSTFKDEVGSVCTIALWMHFILRLRVFAFIGIPLETILVLIKSIMNILFLMLLVIFAFANSFMVLVSFSDDSYFQEQFSGTVNLTDAGLGEENAIAMYDSSSSNNFSNVFKTVYMLWFFIYGVWDPVNKGDAGDDYMIMIFSVLFSFITVLVFINFIIASMSSTAEGFRVRGKRMWITRFAAVIAEIEQVWCTQSERQRSRNNPSTLYYLAKFDDIENHSRQLKRETEQLIAKLKSSLSIAKPKGEQLLEALSNLDEMVEEAGEIGDKMLLRWWQFRQVRYPLVDQ